MVPGAKLAEFCAVAVVLVALPGPSVLFTVSRALVAGRRVALFTVVGNACGLLVQATAVAIGEGAVVERSAAVYTTIKLVGAAYLVILGVQAIRHRHSLGAAFGATRQSIGGRRALRDGLIVGVMNPKSIAFLAAVLPQFAQGPAGDLTAQMVLLGAVFAALAVVLDSVWAVTASAARGFLARSPRRLEAIGGAAGLVMIGVGLSIATTGHKN